MDISIWTIFLLCCGRSIQSTEDIEYLMDNAPKEDIPKMHFDINPEFAQNMRLLVRMDRPILKAILENEAAFYETSLVSLIFPSYNASSSAAHCTTQMERATRKNIVERKIQIEGIVDQILDTMYQKWEEYQTQDDLENYFLKFWEDRNSLFNFVSGKQGQKDCDGRQFMNQSCSAIDSFESVASRAWEDQCSTI